MYAIIDFLFVAAGNLVAMFNIPSQGKIQIKKIFLVRRTLHATVFLF
jgi:hypothetical protein